MQANDLEQTWERYVSIWKAEGANAKRALCSDCLDADCVYTDPLGQARGWDALVANMVGFHEQMPGAHFVTTYFQAHHSRCIAKWNMVGGSGEVLGDGVSYGEFSPQGKLLSMNGFFELPPS